MREIRMSGSVRRGLRPPYPIGLWMVPRGSAGPGRPTVLLLD